MSEWKGEDRRIRPARSDSRADQDHDLLIGIHTMLQGMKENYDKHVVDDEQHFGRLYRSTGNLRWYVGIGLGVVTAIQVIFVKFFK